MSAIDERDGAVLMSLRPKRNINMKLFSHVRKSAKNIKSSWFSDGKLLVRSELDDKIYWIRNMEDFERYNFY